MTSQIVRQIRPQPGPQTTFLSTVADIAIYGGAAGGGKTWALLLEPLRHIHNAEFGAVFFRRNTTQITNEGGLWDEAGRLYPHAGGDPVQTPRLLYKFPTGAKISFTHLEHEKSKLAYQGSQIPLILFDELTHFTAGQFWYLVSRNRSMCGVRPYIRATCNPDPDSWVAEFIAWWIDPETGYAIPERSGVVRWMVRVGDQIHWADSPEELAHHRDAMTGEPIPPKSVTFVSASLSDNRALMQADPGYSANLQALPRVERERLLRGNWKVRPAAGMYFQRGWLAGFVDQNEVPAGTRWVYGWDLAASSKSEATPDPDSTSGTALGLAPDGRIFIGRNVNVQLIPGARNRLIKAEADAARETFGRGVRISIPQDPGAAGKGEVATFSTLLQGHDVRFGTENGDKIVRFSPFSAQAEAGNVWMVRGPWNSAYLDNLEGFPEAKHDDDADSTSRAYRELTEPRRRILAA